MILAFAWAIGKAWSGPSVKVRDYAPMSERLLAAVWPTENVLVLALEMVRE